MDNTTVYVLVIVGYLAASIASFVWVWARSRRIAAELTRVLFLSFIASILFAPTVFECIGIMPVPLPVLAVMDTVATLSPQRNDCGIQVLKLGNGVILLFTWAIVAVVSMIVVEVRHYISVKNL